MKYDSKPCKLLSALQLTGDVFDFVLEAPALAAMAQPGRFAQIRVPGHTLRRPISICGIDKTAGTLRFVFQIRGQGTAELAQFQPGSTIEILAPLGNGFPVDKSKRTLLVGGGIGVPPLLGVAAQLGEKAIAVLGFRTKGAVILEEDFQAAGAKTFIATDDGSYGQKGVVTEALKELIDAGNQYDEVFAIGPMVMMKFVSKTTEPYGIPTTVSMSPIMIDGTGMCGGCRLSVGGEMKFACVDGPDFDGHKVDWDLAVKRNQMYRDFEAHKYEETCNLFKKEAE